MIRFFNELFFLPLIKSVKKGIEQVQAINKKYAVPHIKTTPAVKFSLIVLRLYLIVLVGVLFYKFFTTLTK